MPARTVPLVSCEAVTGKLGLGMIHHSVSCHFCQNTGSRDRVAQRVSLDEGRLRLAKGWYWSAIHQQMLRFLGKLGHCLLHSLVCCLQYINLIYLLRPNLGNAELKSLQ